MDRHGAQGVLDGASKSTLENEFGTPNDDECIIKILEKGSVQVSQVYGAPTFCKSKPTSSLILMLQNAERQGSRNESKSGMVNPGQ